MMFHAPMLALHVDAIESPHFFRIPHFVYLCQIPDTVKFFRQTISPPAGGLSLFQFLKRCRHNRKHPAKQ